MRTEANSPGPASHSIPLRTPLAIPEQPAYHFSPMEPNELRTHLKRIQYSELGRALISAFGVAILVALGSLFLPNYFISEVKILPVEAKLSGGIGQLASAAAAFGVGLPSQDGSEATYVDILDSRWLRESLLNSEFEFHEQPFMIGPSQAHRMTLLAYLKAKNIDQGIRKLGTVLQGSRDSKTKLMTITAETRSPELSQLIVKKAATLLETFLLQKGKTRGGAKAAFAGARLRDAKAELLGSEMVLRDFSERNRNFQTSTDPAVRLQGNRLEADLKLKQQIVVTLALNLEQALMEEKNDLPILNILDDGNLPIEKSRPSRSLIVLFCFFLSFAGIVLYRNRAWVISKLRENAA